jgi:hypothetical protein
MLGNDWQDFLRASYYPCSDYRAQKGLNKPPITWSFADVPQRYLGVEPESLVAVVEMIGRPERSCTCQRPHKNEKNSIE